MKRKKVIINALILTITTMILGFIGTYFRVYLSNKIGAEGMGLFQIIMSISAMTSTLAISGIRVTVTRLIAEEIGKGNTSKIKSIMRKSIYYCLIFGITSAFILFKYSEYISIAWIKDVRAVVPLKILSYSLPFVSISSCYHGYFYGTRKIIRSVGADVIETLTMMGIIIYALGALSPKGLEYTCSLVIVGASVGTIVSAFICYLMYLIEERYNAKHGYNRENIANFSFIKLTSIAFPIGCSAYVQTGLKTVEDILIPSSLRQSGASSSSSLSTFGMVKGMVLPILSFPQIFLASFSTLIIPEIAEANAINRKNRVNYIISKTLKFTLLIAVFATCMFMIFSHEFGVRLFKNNETGVLIKLLAPLIPLMYLDRIVDGSLNALDQQMSTLKFNLIDMVTRIAMILIIIPKLGSNGFLLVIFISTTLNATLSINKLLKVTKLEFELLDWLINPIICASISCSISKFIFSHLSINLYLILMVLVSIFLYFILLVLFRCIKKRDIKWFLDGFKQDIKLVNFDDMKIYKEF